MKKSKHPKTSEQILNLQAKFTKLKKEQSLAVKGGIPALTKYMNALEDPNNSTAGPL